MPPYYIIGTLLALFLVSSLVLLFIFDRKAWKIEKEILEAKHDMTALRTEIKDFKKEIFIPLIIFIPVIFFNVSLIAGASYWQTYNSGTTLLTIFIAIIFGIMMSRALTESFAEYFTFKKFHDKEISPKSLAEDSTDLIDEKDSNEPFHGWLNEMTEK